MRGDVIVCNVPVHSQSETLPLFGSEGEEKDLCISRPVQTFTVHELSLDAATEGGPSARIQNHTLPLP